MESNFLSDISPIQRQTYDGGFVEDIDAGERLSVNSGDNPQDHSGLRAFD
jgi:hypothetical protein